MDSNTTQASWPPPQASMAAIRKRADKACQPCRARKVRCNATDNGEPCNNCRLRETICVPSGDRPNRKNSVNSTKPLSWVNKQPRVFPRVVKHRELEVPDITNSSFRLWKDAKSHDEDRHASLDMQEASHAQAIPDLIQTASIHGDLKATRLEESTARSANEPTKAPIPAYIKPLPQSMPADDIKFLWAKGALSVPDNLLRNELIRCYIEYVHPELPVIQWHDFLKAIGEAGSREGGISLFLFQAVMFAGTAFVDMSFVLKAGFSTRRQFRTAFYQRARLLYDLDYEDDRVALLQSLLLMTLYCENLDNQKDDWHWIAVSIHVAHTLGMHGNLEASIGDVKKLRLYRRLWWCCIMRDQLLSLGMRRPARIHDGDYDVPMLTIEDFEIHSLDGECHFISSDCIVIRDTSMQRHMAMMCIAKAQLCLCINHVLATQYSAHVQDQGMERGPQVQTEAKMILIPKPSSHADKITDCDLELARWFESLPTSCRYNTLSTQELPTGSSAPFVQRAILHMLYFTVISTLHRPRALPTGQSACSDDTQEISRWKIRDAAHEITKIMLALHRLNLTCYLPVTAVTVLLPAVIIHLLDSNSDDDETSDTGRKGLSQCMHVLQQLRANYAPADDAIMFLEAALRKSQIDLGVLSTAEPMEVVATMSTQKTPHDDPELVNPREVEKFQHHQPRISDIEWASQQKNMAWYSMERDGNESQSLQSTVNNLEDDSNLYDVTAHPGQVFDTNTFAPTMAITNTDFDYVYQALMNYNDNADTMALE